MTFLLALLYLACILLAAHPSPVVADLAAVTGPLFGLVALARAFRPRHALEVQS